jgi:hypothetical protein
LQTLGERLGVSGRYRVQARECFHGKDPFCQGGCTGKAFHPAPDWLGDSHQLALAVALYAASVEQTVPPWALFSAALKPGTLRLRTTRSLVEKVRLALGKEGGTEHITPLVLGMYQRERGSTEACIGPQSQRVLPGAVRLLIVGKCDLDCLEKRFPGSSRVTVRPLRYRGFEPDQVFERCVRYDAADGLLVVAVETTEPVGDAPARGGGRSPAGVPNPLAQKRPRDGPRRARKVLAGRL